MDVKNSKAVQSPSESYHSGMSMAIPALQGHSGGGARWKRVVRRFAGHVVVPAVLLATGCVFDPPKTTGNAIPVSETKDYDALTDAPADVVVELFFPYHSPGLGAGAATGLQQGYPVRVREGGTGRVVEYRMSRRGYGTWDAERERELQLALLRSYFLKPGVFDDDSGSATLESLYERARLHDPHTRRYDSATAAEYRRAALTTIEPRVMGIQVRLNDTNDTLSLELVAPESPAWRAGLRRGMVLLAVNDSSVTGDSAMARFARFVDADTLPVRLTFRGPEGVRTETVGRETVLFPSVQVDSIGGAGYIAIYSFTTLTTAGGGSTHSEFRRALEATRRFPATILDLRDNGGGSLAEVLRMADEVLERGIIIRLLERGLHDGASRRLETVWRARAGDRGERRRYVLMANGRTASASEILISALRDNLDVPMVGSTTYGKGVGQAQFDTPGGEAAVITYATALSANGTDYNGTGIAPTHSSSAAPGAMLREAAELAVPGSLARRAADTPDRADVLEWNRRQAMRPGISDWGSTGDVP